MKLGFGFRTVKKVSGKIVQFLLIPIIRTPRLFGSIFFFLLFVPLLNFVRWRYDGSGFGHLARLLEEPVAWAVTVTWAITAVYNVLCRLKKWIGCAWLAISWVLIILNWIIDLGCYLIYEHPFTADLAGVFMATNPEEGVAFIGSFLNARFVLWSVGTLLGATVSGLAFGFLIKFIDSRLTGSNRRNRYIRLWLGLIAVMVLCWAFLISLFFSNPRRLATTNIYGKILEFANVDIGHDVVLQNPELILEQSDVPEKIVVIIGESHSRSHSQLYGYPRPTQPRLVEMAEDSNLVVFAEPVSPAAHTMAALQRVIGTYDGTAGRPWYEHPTWIETARLAGYRVDWVSNQSPKGIYDNPVFKIASIADSHEFTNDGMSGISHRLHDENVLPLIDRNRHAGRQVLVVHLMGSHIGYSQAYPLKDRYFSEKDYPELPVNQRKEIAHYDNSLRYNDRVVESIFNRFRDDDAVVIYLSDHGQDLYETDPDYRGHARGNDPESMEVGRAIPFYIYLSPVFISRHPVLAKRIRRASDRVADTDNLVYTIMDLTGANFADRPDAVKTRSIIR